MRTTAFALLIAFVAMAGSGCVSTALYRHSATDFDAALSPWGHWLSVEGVRVWRPHAWAVGPAFTPYGSHGHWVHTDYGWSFESDFEWGWAAFHYGRWMTVPGHGWVWVPGTRWAPAWVTWRHGGGYIGWAPMAPDWVHVRSSWVFLETRHFVARDFHRYRIPRARVHAAWSVTAPIRTRVHGASWGAGPSRRTVEHAAGGVPRAHIAPPPPGRIVRPRTTSWASPPRGEARPALPPPPRGELRRRAPNQVLTPPRGESLGTAAPRPAPRPELQAAPRGQPARGEQPARRGQPARSPGARMQRAEGPRPEATRPVVRSTRPQSAVAPARPVAPNVRRPMITAPGPQRPELRAR